MRFLRAIAAVLVAAFLSGFIGAGSNSDVVVAPGQRNAFPLVSGINLVGEIVDLPAGFEGPVNLVVLGFEMDQQPDIDTWTEAYERMRNTFPSLRFYEVPVIGAGSAAFRLWVNNGMHLGILEEDARKRTITIYVDRGKFNAAVGVGTVESIYALLVDRSGRILWRAEGRAGESGVKDLAGHIGSAAALEGARARD
jgi:hypothetical protein